VLVAKASSVAGAVVGGAWLGLLVFTAPQAGSIQAAGADTAAAAVGLGCALVLVGGALWLEHCCRTPDDPERPDA
jgi:predicted phage tail protein